VSVKARLLWPTLGFLALLGVGDSFAGQPDSRRTLDCLAYETAGAVDCAVSESWIAPTTFPARSHIVWPPQGYRLIDAALMSETDAGEACVIPIRALIRLRTPNFSETDGVLPRLHDGFPECPAEQRLQPNSSDYGVTVRHLRTLLPRPDIAVQPQNNTIVGIHTRLEMLQRQMSVDTETTVTLASGNQTVRVQAEGTFYVRWRDQDGTTGPYFALSEQKLPIFVYDTSGNTFIEVFDVWNVRVSAEGLPTFHDVVYIGYPELEVRVNELVIRAVPGENAFASQATRR